MDEWTDWLQVHIMSRHKELISFNKALLFYERNLTTLFVSFQQLSLPNLQKEEKPNIVSRQNNLIDLPYNPIGKLPISSSILPWIPCTLLQINQERLQKSYVLQQHPSINPSNLFSVLHTHVQQAVANIFLTQNEHTYIYTYKTTRLKFIRRSIAQWSFLRTARFVSSTSNISWFLKMQRCCTWWTNFRYLRRVWYQGSWGVI